jgi:Methyltransferase domain
MSTLADYFNSKFEENNNGGDWARLYYGVFSDVINQNNYTKVAEIGAGYGTHAKQVMDNTSVKTYYIIDPMVYYEDDFALGIHRAEGTTDNNFDEFYGLVNDALSSYSKTYKWLRKTSADVTSAEIADGSLDAIFIDGDHSVPAVQADLEFAWAKVKSGGKILGDDYWIGQLAEAVNAFAEENGVEVEILNNGSDYHYIYCMTKP